jgi:hypothetical protein
VSVQLRPLLVRPEQAALLLGSGEVVTDFTKSGWLAPVVAEHRLVLYAYRHLEDCVRRLESGEIVESAHGTGSVRMSKAGPVSNNASFLDQIRGIVSLKPFLLRPGEAAVFVGSVGLLEEFRRAAWIKPLYDRHRLVLFSVRHLESCVARLEVGEKPGAYAETPPPATAPVMVKAVIPSMFIRRARRTRRPMPVCG